MGKKKSQNREQQPQEQQPQEQQPQTTDTGIPQDPQQQPDQLNPTYVGSAGGQPVGGGGGGIKETDVTYDGNTNSGSDSSGNADTSTLSSGDSTFEEPIRNKSSIAIIVFGSVITIYIVVSALIYIASYVVKNKEDDLTEDFYKEITKEKKENNQFFMDPALHKSPVIKAAAEKEEGSYQKYDNSDDYDHIWDNFIVTGKKDDIEIDVNNRKEYPPTTPITPISPSPLQQSFTNESYNMATDVAQKRSIGHRESNSTSSSTASVSNLIPKSQKKANEAYNNEDVAPRSPPVPAHHQFPNSRSNGPQIKFTMDQKHDNRGQLTPPSHKGSHNASPRSPRPSPNVERQGSQGSPRPIPPSQRGPDRQGSQGSGRPMPPNQRGPDRQGSQNSPRLPPPRNVNPERQGSQGSPRLPPPRNVNPERQGSQGGYNRPPPPRNPNLDRQGSNGNMRPPQNSRPQPRH